MGAWSYKPFGNDAANDWAYGLEGLDDFSLIEETLDRALDAGDYLEAPEASEAVAAAEVLAKMLGRGTETDSYTEKVDAWIKSVTLKPDAALLAKAARALDRVLGENSELRELWQEGDGAQWLASIATLQSALSA